MFHHVEIIMGGENITDVFPFRFFRNILVPFKKKLITDQFLSGHSGSYMYDSLTLLQNLPIVTPCDS